jgi:hypothetical protein
MVMSTGVPVGVTVVVLWPSDALVVVVADAVATVVEESVESELQAARTTEASKPAATRLRLLV